MDFDNKKRGFISIFVFIALIAVIILAFKIIFPKNRTDKISEIKNARITDVYGDTIYLKKYGGNKGYKITDNEQRYHKKLVWQEDISKYYDEDSNVYVWCDTSQIPYLWEYEFVNELKSNNLEGCVIRKNKMWYFVPYNERDINSIAGFITHNKYENMMIRYPHIDTSDFWYIVN